MDLPPEVIGGRCGYRIRPAIGDAGAIAGQLAEILGGSADDFDSAVIDQMIRLMRRGLRAGRRIVYDERDNLLELHARAVAGCAPPLDTNPQAQQCEQADS